MKKRTKKVLIVLAFLVTALVIVLVLQPSLVTFAILQTEGKRQAGTWEDDPKNWYRAFKTEQPPEVTVIHSKYWRSDHFTDEHMYFFEVRSTPEWKDSFLRSRKVEPVPPSKARSFRDNNGSDVPIWFASDSTESFEVWDQPGYYGSIWINKTNGHIFFFDIQL
jgi:hypothetical protein